jgi:hypothetical protein
VIAFERSPIRFGLRNFTRTSSLLGLLYRVIMEAAGRLW